MTKQRTIACLLLAFLTTGVSPAPAQLPQIGTFLDPSASNCNIVDTPGLVSVYVVVYSSPARLSAIEFSAPPPACFDAVWAGDESPFPLTIGDSQTGMSIALGGCGSSPLHVVTINFISNGGTPPCCEYPLSAAPGETDIRFITCDSEPIVGQTLFNTINGDSTCFCGVNPPPTPPANPAPWHTRDGLPVYERVLEWECSDPEGDPIVFDVYFGTDPSPPLVASEQPAPLYQLDILDYFTDYYWKIVARDAWGMETAGPVWQFRTQGQSDSRLVVGSVLNYCGLTTSDTVTVAVTMEDAAIEIDEGSIDIGYGNGELVFLDCEPGDLTVGWDSFQWSDLTTHIRVQGSSTTPIAAGTSGTFATLSFLSDCCGSGSGITVDLCAENVTGDLRAQWAPCGQFQCAVYAPDGDVTEDGSITPADALCAFEGYLSFPDSPASGCGSPGWDVRGDVDCNGQVTPGDALCVFHSWLNGSCVFCEPAASPNRGFAAEGAGRERPLVSVGELHHEGGETIIPVLVSGIDELSAFGFEATFPGLSSDISARRSEATQRFDQFGSRSRADGGLRVGGFTSEALAVVGQTSIVELTLSAPLDAVTGELTINEFVDDLAGAEPVTVRLSGTDFGSSVPSSYALHQNHPNPFNPVTEIVYEIPAGARLQRVTLTVFSIEAKSVRGLVDANQGEGIHHVRWDGRNDAGEPVSSGVYFYVLRTSDRAFARKMVLLK